MAEAAFVAIPSSFRLVFEYFSKISAKGYKSFGQIILANCRTPSKSKTVFIFITGIAIVTTY